MKPALLARVLCVLGLLAALGMTTARASDLQPAVRDAVVRVELAVNPASGGPALMRDFATRESLTGYQKELLRRLKAGAVGTGFFVNSDGYLVTNAHVVLSGVRYRNLKFTDEEWASLRTALTTFRDIWVTVGEGEEAHDYLATPVAIAEDLDLAILKVQVPPNCAVSFNYFPVTNSDQVHVGDAISSLGFPNYEFQHSHGRILSLIQGKGVQEEMQVVESVDPTTHRQVVLVSGTSEGPVMRLQHDAPTGHGTSGGPLLDANGHVIGVAYALLAETDADGNPAQRTDLNLGIASRVLIRFLKEDHVSFTEAAP